MVEFMQEQPSRKPDEVRKLAEWSRTVAEFRHGLGIKINREHADKFHEQEIEIIERIINKKNLRGARIMYNDNHEWGRDLHRSLYDELDTILMKRFGWGLAGGTKDLEKQSRAILKRGKIRKADEYRVLERWLDVILEDSAMKTDVDRVNALLMTVKQVLPE